jgi:histidinol-phosphatase
MKLPSIQDLLDVAVEAAYLGGRRTLAYFNAGVEAMLKNDGTPVTVADQEAEQLIVRHIARHFPDHAILGEETGMKEGTGGGKVRWIVDPIDGTKTFLCGVPMYGTLIGVEIDGRCDVGVIYLPATDEMIAAGRGLGCRWNGRPAQVRATAELKDAVVLTTDDATAHAALPGYAKLQKACKFSRTWSDCYGYALIATGRADVMFDPVINPWDVAAILPCIEEAGGRFTNLANEPTIYGRGAIATNGRLHEPALGHLRG